jgi:hypothetical protein
VITLLAFAGVALYGATFLIDDCARLLVADVRLAMKRADLSLDYVARCIAVPIPKLSDQLNGKTPFTAWWRFACLEIRRDTTFWLEFAELQAARVDRVLVRADVGTLIAKVEALVGHKPMARMAMPSAQQQERVG